MVPGFADAFQLFEQQVKIQQLSRGLLTNYGRSIAYVAIHFNRLPHLVSIDELNAYFYRATEVEGRSISYFKHAVFGLRFWFRLFGMDDHALKLPSIRKNNTLPVVLSKEECKILFKAPQTLKHRFLLAFAYGCGLRMNELRLLKISDVDLHRQMVHIRQGKGKKDRYVILGHMLSDRFNTYLAKANPRVYVFEGQIPGEPMGERSIQYVVNEALKRTEIKKQVSMHTLRHSYATHLLEDGVDLHSIQRLLGHADLRTTMVYLHVAQIRSKPIHSPLDSLYGFATS
jgi:site-specific recombinase XerD